MKNVLFICTSNRDRSPAMAEYFNDLYPENYYRSAGVNKYFTDHYKTHLVTWEDILWADLIVFAESSHAELTWHKIFNVPIPHDKEQRILDCGEFNAASPDDYLTKAEEKISHNLI